MRIVLAAVICVAASWTSGGSIAQEEPILNVYNWSDYIAEDTLAQFERETGIHVNYDVYDNNEILESKLLVGNSGYDIVVPSGNFLARQIRAGVIAPLDKSKVPNLENMNPVMMAVAAQHDPNNDHSVPYMTFTIGLGYNTAKVARALGTDAPIDSWDVLFKPESAAKLAQCGIAILDSPTEVVGIILNYLGRDPNSEASEDLEAARAVLRELRPHVRYYHSSQYIGDLAAGEICIALGYSGDMFIAARAGRSAQNPEDIKYVIPNEGTATLIDLLAIPVGAPHPGNAHKFIDYLMRPEVIAPISDHVFYANANLKATPLISQDIRNNPGIYPPADILQRAFALRAHSPEFDELLTDAWTRMKIGQ